MVQQQNSAIKGIVLNKEVQEEVCITLYPKVNVFMDLFQLNLSFVFPGI